MKNLFLEKLKIEMILFSVNWNNQKTGLQNSPKSIYKTKSNFFISIQYRWLKTHPSYIHLSGNTAFLTIIQFSHYNTIALIMKKIGV